MSAIRPRKPGDAGPIVPQVPHVLYGSDYNPEQWDRDVWREDVRLMQEAGVNLVSLGIFSWAQLEPRPGVYEFEWLDEVLDLLHTHGVKRPGQMRLWSLQAVARGAEGIMFFVLMDCPRYQ